MPVETKHSARNGVLIDQHKLLLRSRVGAMVAAGGAKLGNGSEPQVNPDLSGLFNRGFVNACNVSPDQLTLFLGGGLDRPVIDATGLNGKYDFDRRWIADGLAITADSSSPPGPSLFAALREQLGLELESNVSGEFALLDHVEHPTAN